MLNKIFESLMFFIDLKKSTIKSIYFIYEKSIDHELSLD